MEIKVVENMDVPPRTRTRVYPFRDMKIGSGFKVLFNSTDPQVIDRVSKKIRSAVGNYHKEHPDFVYETRTVGADDQTEPSGAGICVRRVQMRAKMTTLKVV
jgi:hypothetical protein